MRKEECLEKFVTTYTRQVSSVWLYIAILTALFFLPDGISEKAGTDQKVQAHVMGFSFQRVTGQGLCETDDVMGNTLVALANAKLDNLEYIA